MTEQTSAMAATSSDRVRRLREGLVWAAGRPGAAPDLHEAELPPFLEALDAHRLDGRFLRRCAAEPDAFPAEFTAAVAERFAGVQAGVRSQSEVAASVSARLSRDTGHPPIVLKGSTLWQITGDPYTMRRSGDIDFVGADPEATVEAVTAEDYRRHGPVDILDEYAELRSEAGRIIEVHSYYEIPRLPAERDRRRYSPAANPGGWRQELRLSGHRWEYAHLDRHRARTADPPALVLRPEAAIFVNAAHMFGDYVRTPFVWPKGTIKLDEVATVCDLADHSAFDRGLFLRLLHELDGHDVIAFVRALALDLLGRDPLPGLPDTGSDWRLRERAFPVDLWWDGVDGYLVDLGWHPEQLLIRDEQVSAETVLYGLHVNALDATAPDRELRFSALDGSAAAVEHAVFRTEKGAAFSVAGTVVRHPWGLSIEVALPPAPTGCMSAISLNFGDYRYEGFYTPEDDDYRWDDYSLFNPDANGADSGAFRRAGRDTFSFTLPWDALGVSKDAAAAALPLLLGVRHQRLRWGPMRAGAVIPLRISV
ncbi:nucleotidyltransferase family protein [Streptomonospora sp. PA3]|uniref:nucleotidyltransferase family protein n=1 Tax=Streptomonospora sp. PA3 TaxID=2607326 RepID=UPI001642834D|nr:nucleotidyltransferase family protein [Streptomonospora sp. PA3]